MAASQANVTPLPGLYTHPSYVMFILSGYSVQDACGTVDIVEMRTSLTLRMAWYALPIEVEREQVGMRVEVEKRPMSVLQANGSVTQGELETWEESVHDLVGVALHTADRDWMEVADTFW